jgi:hypothetical protein
MGIPELQWCRRTVSLAPRLALLIRAIIAHERRDRRVAASSLHPRDEALKVLLQNLLDSPLIAFIWGIGRRWSVRVD